MEKDLAFLGEPLNFMVVAAYLLGTRLILWYTKSRKSPLLRPEFLKQLLAAHNLFLCAASIVMTAGYAYNLVGTASHYGFFGSYCGVSEEVDERLFFWTNVFYLSKFYELFDTIFIVLEGKTPIFLHLYHHSVVIILVSKSLQHRLLMSWFTGLLNCFVHIFMYYYFFKRSLGVEVWWRKYITKIQILQFLLDGLSSLPFLYFRWAGLPCSGTWSSWIGGNFVGFSFFLLFVKFYRDSYKDKRTPSSKSQSDAKEE